MVSSNFVYLIQLRIYSCNLSYYFSITIWFVAPFHVRKRLCGCNVVKTVTLQQASLMKYSCVTDDGQTDR